MSSLEKGRMRGTSSQPASAYKDFTENRETGSSRCMVGTTEDIEWKVKEERFRLETRKACFIRG